MRDRRLHDRGEDKHPPPRLHPFYCLTSPHVFIISSRFLSSVCPPASRDLTSSFYPYVCTTCEHYLAFIHKLCTSILLSALFFCFFSISSFSAYFHVFNCILNFTEPAFSLLLGKKNKKSVPRMHRSHLDFEALELWGINPYWFGIWIIPDKDLIHHVLPQRMPISFFLTQSS